MITLPRRLLVVTLLIFALLQSGCSGSEEDKQFVRSLVQEFLESKNISPVSTNDKGEQEFDFWGTVNGLRTVVTGRTGDAEADAVLGIYSSVSGVIEADKAMDEARANGDAAAMDAVIASRPHDYTYRSSRAALALAQGDMNTYQQQVAESDRLAAERKVPESQKARRTIADYEGIVVPDTGEQCYLKYTELSMAYDALYRATQDNKWSVLTWEAAGAAAACE